MLPGYQAVTGRSYNTAMQQMERAQIYCHQCSKPLGRCQCTLAAGCTRMAYSVSCTSAKTIETNYLKGPGYQNPPPSSLVQPVFEGTRSVIFPRREIDATRPYSASAANAVSLPWRASVSKAVSELPEEPANWTLPNERSGVLGVGHEQMPGYAQFVDSQALGKQSHYDPECITDAMRRGYQETLYDGIAL
ncbi:hypothetical protein T484DRAFT_1742201 [Baffinella frigidus]|nr:hypothetical protein T484DRAFT_1742201 [Cryptophyta sp. CCMP2293]